ncbi:RNA polymerase sigma factor SigY [Cytobacillus sp. NCCP-133]|uniref:RNA polymerase sigma factor SigY n=1 Tax=Cytobacillus sp. NCCP-133 TaxID=766848 RepID=UPI0022325F8B|nr:RNA polymerase sigma factor SigY [Cytobacillus sp. NCCP-133]GLB58759.1 RNA polymerase sigma factor SigY [Cytobacillus sp. NCCP-133]
MEEKDLIISAKRGDQLAFAMLFKNNYPFLVKYLIKITMNPDIAEELAQETMAKCVEKIDMFNGKAKFSSWLISIATNLYIDQQRKSIREKKWKQQEKDFRRMKWQLESRKEEWNEALSALGKLKEDVRIPIILKHYYGYSYEEIGDMMNLFAGTVKSRVHNGIMDVRKELRLHDESKSAAART